MNIYLFLLITIIIICKCKCKYTENMENNYSYIINYNGQSITTIQFVNQGIATVRYENII